MTVNTCERACEPTLCFTRIGWTSWRRKTREQTLVVCGSLYRVDAAAQAQSGRKVLTAEVGRLRRRLRFNCVYAQLSPPHRGCLDDIGELVRHRPRFVVHQ